MKRMWFALRLAAIVCVMAFVAVSHFGCEEEPSRPASCGKGPFERDAKDPNVCRRVSDRTIVDGECCNYN